MSWCQHGETDIYKIYNNAVACLYSDISVIIIIRKKEMIKIIQYGNYTLLHNEYIKMVYPRNTQLSFFKSNTLFSKCI